MTPGLAKNLHLPLYMLSDKVTLKGMSNKVALTGLSNKVALE